MPSLQSLATQHPVEHVPTEPLTQQRSPVAHLGVFLQVPPLHVSVVQGLLSLQLAFTQHWAQPFPSQHSVPVAQLS
jgi:hypothetical protein